MNNGEVKPTANRLSPEGTNKWGNDLSSKKIMSRTPGGGCRNISILHLQYTVCL